MNFKLSQKTHPLKANIESFDTCPVWPQWLPFSFQVSWKYLGFASDLLPAQDRALFLPRHPSSLGLAHHHPPPAAAPEPESGALASQVLVSASLDFLLRCPGPAGGSGCDSSHGGGHDCLFFLFSYLHWCWLLPS